MIFFRNSSCGLSKPGVLQIHFPNKISDKVKRMLLTFDWENNTCEWSPGQSPWYLYEISAYACGRWNPSVFKCQAFGGLSAGSEIRRSINPKPQESVIHNVRIHPRAEPVVFCEGGWRVRLWSPNELEIAYDEGGYSLLPAPSEDCYPDAVSG
jgi:hypothetical protein